MFDKSKPYQTALTSSGAHYIQGGVRYNAAFKPIGTAAKVDLENDKPTYEREPAGKVLKISGTLDKDDTTREMVEEGRIYANWHWRKLKAELEKYGAPYTTKEEAISFLEQKEAEGDIR